MATVNLKAFPVAVTKRCIKCTGSITLYDPEGSGYFVCPKCLSYTHYGKEGFQVSAGVAPEVAESPLIPIGTEGVLNDIAYKVIGYMEKKEAGTPYCWKEYMLYSFTKGYAFLAEYNGHWSYIAGSEHFPDLSQIKNNRFVLLHFRENDFSIYNKYEPVITGLAGEFDWDVLDERVKTCEYVLPPYLLVNEKNSRNGHNNWYLGEYIERSEIAKAFGLSTGIFPWRKGVGANQPSMFYHQSIAAVRVATVFVLAVVLFGLVKSIIFPERQIFSQSYDMRLSALGKKDSVTVDSLGLSNAGQFEYEPFKSTSFSIERPTPLEITVSTDVDNNWTEATIVLANEQTNETWEVTKSIEYYHGYEDGEGWAEGSTVESVLLSHIPPGRYHLNIYPYSGQRKSSTLNITILEQGALWRNVFITILFIALYPLFCWLMSYNFERRRWLHSDYSPYQTDHDDE